MFDRLKKHHLGFIVSLDQKEALEKRYERKFILDPIQKTHVMFVYDEPMAVYIEFICQEGRVAHHKPGFAHICYEVTSQKQLEEIENFIKENKMGFKVTNLEESVTEECGSVTFYFLKDIGMIELNLKES